MITEKLQELISEIFTDSGRPDKMSIDIDIHSRDITVTYSDLDDEWFKEVQAIIEDKGKHLENTNTNI